MHVRLGITGGKSELFKVHQLVATAFLNYDRSKYDRHDIRSLVVDHIDGDKTNNKLDNLEVVTQAENIHRYWKRIKSK